MGSRVLAKYEELRYRDNYETDHGGIEAGFGYSMTFICLNFQVWKIPESENSATLFNNLYFLIVVRVSPVRSVSRHFLLI